MKYVILDKEKSWSILYINPLKPIGNYMYHVL